MKKILAMLVLLVLLTGCTRKIIKEDSGIEDVHADELSEELGQEIGDIGVLDETFNFDEEFTEFEEDLEGFEW